MKVLIGVDGSSGSSAAVRLVGQLLSPERDQVALYYAPPEIHIRDAGPAASEVETRARQALVESIQADAVASLPEPLHQKLEMIVGEKPPRQGMLIAAEDWRAELIVLGAHGTGPLNKVALGTVSRTVVQHARVPVLVVRGDKPRTEAGLRVLLATDASPASEVAVNLLSRFTWPAGTQGYVLRVIESLLAGNVPDWLQEQARRAEHDALARAWAEEHAQERQQELKRLEELTQRLPEQWESKQVVVEEGHPAEQILKLIGRESIDLVVVGAHGKTAWERFLLGSTSEKVLLHANCSVLVARSHERP